MSSQTIKQHEGSKYLKRISSPVEKDDADRPAVIHVDVYAVLEAFDVTCPAIAHCLKKLLMPGQRGKGDIQADLKGAMAALNRAIELEDIRQGSPREHSEKIPLPPGTILSTRTRPLSTEGPEALKARLEEITGGVDKGLEKIAEVAGINTLENPRSYDEQREAIGIGTEELEEEVEEKEVVTKDTLREKIQKMMTKNKEDKKLLDPIEEPRYPNPPEEGE